MTSYAKGDENLSDCPKSMPRSRKYWIEDYPEIRVSSSALLPLTNQLTLEGQSSDITIVITRADLSDDLLQPHEAAIPTYGRPYSEVVPTSTEASQEGVLDRPAKRRKTIEQSTTEDMFKDIVPDTTTESTDPAFQDKPEGSPKLVPFELHSDDSKSSRKREPQISVVRVSSTSSFPRTPRSSRKFTNLPHGDCGDGIPNPHDASDVQDKFWAQRRRLFSKFDMGIKMDSEGWFSVTPEVIAHHIARRVARDGPEGMVIMDAFCGVGGNAVAFASHPDIALVVCVDNNLERLKLTANNLGVYNIPPEKIVLIHEDACRTMRSYLNGALIDGVISSPALDEPRTLLSGFKCGGLELLPTKLDAIFLSPPWGGPEYLNLGPRQYTLSNIKLDQDTDGDDILCYATAAVGARQNVVCFLPRNTNGLSLARSAFLAGLRGCVEMEMNVINGKFKAISVYFCA